MIANLSLRKQIWLTDTLVARLALATALLLSISVLPGMAQQSLPDAPAPQNNASQSDLPAPDSTVPSRPTPGAEGPGQDGQAEQPKPEQQPTPDGTEPAPSPKPKITTLAPGQQPSGATPERDQLFTLTKELNFVLVPVMVKDTSRQLVNGLLKQNFSVLENGVPQNITFFTSDPFPLSAAIIIDVDLPNIVFDRLKETFSSLTGAFSQYDEIAVYTYENTVRKRQDFLGALSDKTTATLRSVRKIEGRSSGPAIADSPMTAGPSVNGRPVPDTGRTILTADNRAHLTSAVLNDAILQAAVDLGRRDPTRRKIIFVISDGREQGSVASYSEVLKVLLTNNVALYAVGVDTAGLPVYDKLQKVRLPGQGSGNILPKYASATGGEELGELSRGGIEDSYLRLTEEARNQYTLGYYSSAAKGAIAYRAIDVRVNRSKLKVYARDGYYPVSPAER